MQKSSRVMNTTTIVLEVFKLTTAFEEMIKELNQNLAKRLKDCPEISKEVEKISSKKKVSHSRQDEITHEPEIE